MELGALSWCPGPCPRPAATQHAPSHPPPPPPPQLYHNLPLPPESTRHIRLLDLEAPPRDRAGNLVETVLAGRLRIANLDDATSFTALSYVWGSPSHPRTISCSPEVPALEITENCHAALRQIQRRFGAVTIWVDSICINQRDDDEKTTQIPLMQDIYTKATTVYIWLGVGTESSDRAMSYLETCGIRFQRWPGAWLAATTEKSRDLERKKFLKESYRDIPRRVAYLLNRRHQLNTTSICAKDIHDLLSREWVLRAWTFQELILAAHPLVLCGSYTLSWDCLLNAVQWLDKGRRPGLSFPSSHPFEEFDQRNIGSHIASAPRHWRMLADLWVQFPRPADRGLALGTSVGTCDNNTTPRNTSFLERAERLDARGQLSGPVLISTLLLQIAALAGLSGIWYGSFRAVKSNHWVVPTLIPFFSLAYYFLIVSPIIKLHDFIAVGDEPPLPNKYDRSVIAGLHIALRHRLCQSSHDKAIALGGILSTLGMPMPRPSYQDSVGHTYLDLMSRMIKWNSDFTAMLVDAGSQTLSDAPSWVPNWSCQPPSFWLSSRYIAGGVESRCFGVYDWLYCSELPEASVDINKLSIFGASYGAVGYRTPPLATDFRTRPRSDDPETVPPVMEAFISWTQQPGIPTPPTPCPREVRMYAVLRGLTLIKNQRRGRGPPPADRSTDPCGEAKQSYEFSDEGEDFGLWLELYHCGLERTPATPPEAGPGGSGVQAIYQKLQKVNGGLALLDRLLEQVAVDERCLFSLPGGLVGSGPLGMQAGDEVFALNGVPTPMVLRKSKTEEAYVMIGAAHVHGLIGIRGDPFSRDSIRYKSRDRWEVDGALVTII
ncbi:heterokaryon incompatibility protein-domain-containing protein [Podospora conica]|nr:heterokaryon incompatibility protein-domain-containing protein [Schizothecium conicum]